MRKYLHALNNFLSQRFLYLNPRPGKKLFPTVAHNCHGKRNNIAAKERDSRQKGITSRQKGKGSQQNKKPHGKKKKTHGKRKNLPASTALFNAVRTLLFLLP